MQLVAPTTSPNQYRTVQGVASVIEVNIKEVSNLVEDIAANIVTNIKAKSLVIGIVGVAAE